MDMQPQYDEPERSSRLPSTDANKVRTWAGNGSGASCTLCKLPIAAHEIEYEVELTTPAKTKTLRFHVPCYHTWTLKAASSHQTT